MPTYQYACMACEHRFEAVQSFSDASLTDCPECEGRLRKVFSNVGIVFKGSGFYRTDSRATPANGDAPAKEKAGAGAAKEGAAKEGAGKEGAGKEGSAKESSGKESSGGDASSTSSSSSSGAAGSTGSSSSSTSSKTSPSTSAASSAA